MKYKLLVIRQLQLNFEHFLLVIKSLFYFPSFMILATRNFRLQEQAKTHYSVNPTEGNIIPGDSQTLEISCYFTDNGVFNDRLIINVNNGAKVKTTVIARGVGTSISVEPQISPEYDFKSLFTFKKYYFEFVFRNHGVREHRIAVRKWSLRKERMKHTKKSERLVKIIEDKFFFKFSIFRIQGPIKVTPDRFTLSGNSSITVSIEIYSEKLGEIVENWFAEAAIEQSPELHQLFTISVKAMLVEPHLLFSTQRVNFRIDKGSEANFYHVQGRFL